MVGNNKTANEPKMTLPGTGDANDNKDSNNNNNYYYYYYNNANYKVSWPERWIWFPHNTIFQTLRTQTLELIKRKIQNGP